MESLLEPNAREPFFFFYVNVTHISRTRLLQRHGVDVKEKNTMVLPERWKMYAHQRETTASSNDSLQLRPFAKWETSLKGDSNPNDKYVLSERALWTMNFDTSIIKIGWQTGSYGHLKNSIWPTFSRHFEYLISFQFFFNCLISSYQYYHSICVSADMQLYT